ncbi:MAG: molybdate ABC transporter substrate-binding protein [Planctomycetota bacterium]
MVNARIRTMLSLLACPLVLLACDGESSPAVTVFAAASTHDVMRAAEHGFEASHDVEVVLSIAASSTLARQIDAGAPADLFVSAHVDWMNHLEDRGSIRADAMVTLFGNELVVIAPKRDGIEAVADQPSVVSILEHAKRIAIGDPAHVPLGQYTVQALRGMEAYERALPRLMPAVDARATLRLVEIGEADIGIVYATDARGSDRVHVVAHVASSLHDPIEYHIAPCTTSAHAGEFITYLRSDDMREVFREAGFRIMDSESNP